MEIKRIDHYSIRTLDVEASRRFYTEIIGLKVGPRPPFDFPGVWLYKAGRRPISITQQLTWCVMGIDATILKRSLTTWAARIPIRRRTARARWITSRWR